MLRTHLLMKLVNDKCSCCDERVLGIEFRTDDVQQTEDGTLILTFNKEEMSEIYTDMTRALATTK